jgi:chemotaxis-related protein WspD
MSDARKRAPRPPAGTGLARTTSPAPPAVVEDCWNTIGVTGDSSCGELEKFVQCHNCPVFARAGLNLLNRPLPPDYRREWTDYLGVNHRPAAGRKPSVVMFRVDREWMALPTHAFQEVAEHRPVHSLPHRCHGVVLGLVNVRGELLLCLSISRLLGLDPGASPEKLRTYYDRLLVVAWEGKRLTFPADEVHGLHRFAPGDLCRPPPTITRAALTFTLGLFPWQQQMVALLDPELLFSTLNRSLS